MSLKPIRDYLKNQIKEVDSAFRENDKPFTSDTISKANFEKSFHVYTESLEGNSVNHISTSDTLPVRVKLFFAGHNETQTKLNSALDMANLIRLRVLHPRILKTEPRIKNIICSFNPEAVENNSKDIIINMDFRVNVNFSLDEINLS